MSHVFLSALLITTGLIAASVGVAMARHRVQMAHRLHARTVGRCAILMEDWNGWFVGGFSDITTGLRFLAAASLWALWTLAGAALVALGLRFLRLL